MGEVTTIGLDVPKQVFQAYGADASGAQVFSRRVTRAKLLGFFASQPSCPVALEACGGSHHWARELKRLGHEVRLRRLLIVGSSAVVLQASRRGAPAGSWLAQMMARKPRMLVTVALANKTARIVWALLSRGGIYRAPAAAA